MYYSTTRFASYTINIHINIDEASLTYANTESAQVNYYNCHQAIKYDNNILDCTLNQ